MTGLLLVSALAVWRPEFRDRWSTASDTLGRVCREAQEANVTQEEHLPTLHLVFPLDARSHGERSCKSILAALVNGYKPVVVNWDLVLSINELYSAKIPGEARHLKRFPTSISRKAIYPSLTERDSLRHSAFVL